MNLLDSLFQNMTVRTRGVTTQRLSFLESTLDQSSRKMISRSLSKMGKSKQVLQKQKQQGLKAMYKLSLLINKKIKAINFNFFIKLEEHVKQIKLQKQQEIPKQIIIHEVLDEKQMTFAASQPNTQRSSKRNKYEIIGNMCEIFNIYCQREFSYNYIQEAFVLIKKYSSKLSVFNSGFTCVQTIMNNYQTSFKLQTINILKHISKQTQRIELFSAIINSIVFRNNTEIKQQSFGLINKHSELIKQNNISVKSTLTQDSSIILDKLSPKTQKITSPPHLEFRFHKNEIEQVKNNRSFKLMTPKCKQFKSPSVSIIQPFCEMSETNTSNIFIEKVITSVKPCALLKIQTSQTLKLNIKEQQKMMFFGNEFQNIPRQLYKLYSDEIVNQIHDTTEPFGLFDISQKDPFKAINKDVSRIHSQQKLKTKNSNKVIKLKNSFIESNRGDNIYCTPKKTNKLLFSDPRKSIGLKSSRRIKQSCVGQQWQRIDIQKIMKTEYLFPSKEMSATSKLSCRQRNSNPISIVKSQIFSKQKHDVINHQTHSKKISCEVLSRFGKI